MGHASVEYFGVGILYGHLPRGRLAIDIARGVKVITQQGIQFLLLQLEVLEQLLYLRSWHLH